MPDRSDQLRRLGEALDAPPGELDYLEPLDEAGLARLHDLVRASLAAEEQRVQEALQATMRFVPRPLRGRAKKLLFPEGHR